MLQIPFCSNQINLVSLQSAVMIYDRPQEKVMFLQASVSHSVHSQPHGHSVTAHPFYGAVGTHLTGMLSC